MTTRKVPVTVTRKAYSLTDAGRAYGISEAAISKAVHSGALRAKYVDGKQIRVEEKALEEWYAALPDVH